MVSFSKLPSVVAFCVVVLTKTLGSATPVPQTDDDPLIFPPGLFNITLTPLFEIVDGTSLVVGDVTLALEDVV